MNEHIFTTIHLSKSHQPNDARFAQRQQLSSTLPLIMMCSLCHCLNFVFVVARRKEIADRRNSISNSSCIIRAIKQW